MSLLQAYRDVCAANAFVVEAAGSSAVIDRPRFSALVERYRTRLRSHGVARGDAVLFHGDRRACAV